MGFKGFVGLFGPFGIKSLGLRALLVLFRLIQGVRALKILGLGGLGFRNPTQQFQHPCAFETAVCGNSSPSHNCLKYEPMHQIQATPLKTGEFVDSLAPQRGANSFSPVVVSSSWVVDGYSLLLAGVMWWNRRPRRL